MYNVLKQKEDLTEMLDSFSKESKVYNKAKNLPKAKFLHDLINMQKSNSFYILETKSDLLNKVTIDVLTYMESTGCSRNFTNSITLFDLLVKLKIIKPNILEKFINSFFSLPKYTLKTLKDPEKAVAFICKNFKSKTVNTKKIFVTIFEVIQNLNGYKNNQSKLNCIPQIKEFINNVKETHNIRTVEDALNILSWIVAMYIEDVVITSIYENELKKANNENNENEINSIICIIANEFNIKNIFENKEGFISLNLNNKTLNLVYSISLTLTNFMIINQTGNLNLLEELKKELKYISEFSVDTPDNELVKINGYESVIYNMFNISLISNLNSIHRYVFKEDISIIGNKFLEITDNIMNDLEIKAENDNEMISTFINSKNNEIDKLLKVIREQETEIENLKKQILNKLKNKKCVIIGDSSRTEGYTQIIEKYGGKVNVLNPFKMSDSRIADQAQSADEVFYITAFNKHSVESMLDSRGIKKHNILVAGLKSLEDYILYEM